MQMRAEHTGREGVVLYHVYHIHMDSSYRPRRQSHTVEGWSPERWVRASLWRHPSGAGTIAAKGQQGSASATGQKKGHS